MAEAPPCNRIPSVYGVDGLSFSTIPSTIEQDTVVQGSFDDQIWDSAIVDGRCLDPRPPLLDSDKEHCSVSSDLAYALSPEEYTLDRSGFRPRTSLSPAGSGLQRDVNGSLQCSSGQRDDSQGCIHASRAETHSYPDESLTLQGLDGLDIAPPMNNTPEQEPSYEAPGLCNGLLLNDHIIDGCLSPGRSGESAPVEDMDYMSNSDLCTVMDDDDPALIPSDSISVTSATTHTSRPPSQRSGRTPGHPPGDRSKQTSPPSDPGPEQCFSRRTDSENYVENEASKCDYLRPRTRSPSPTKSTKDYIEFSHIEISNVSTARTDRLPVLDPKEEVENPPCRHFPPNRRPWRLEGTVLSIDIREVQRLPIFAGTSSFRVLDGQLFQTITLSLGAVDSGLPPKKQPPRVPGQRGVSATRGPLSSKQKRYLVQLRNEGHTWNQISVKFPGRKKGTLQAAYYKELKCFPSQVSRSAQRCSSSRKTSNASNSLNSQSHLAKDTGDSRYYLRARANC
ncbi:hypothetical protein BDV59DRAFT_189943 [Aspergillus ambiguus]|uniref:uncharacterized protein n=1 Tax=Aspergillus ambiguus TaxID=176160 RepID=UPI003CCD3B59